MNWNTEIIDLLISIIHMIEKADRNDRKIDRNNRKIDRNIELI